MRLLSLILSVLTFTGFAAADALEDYLKRTDSSYAWSKKENKDFKKFRFYTLDLTSQVWRGITWKHELGVLVPEEIFNKTTPLVLISGSREVKKNIPFLYEIASVTKSPVAVIGSIPVQPLFDGKTEDKLLAYTLRNYIDSGDTDWPILFPMVKSVIKGMDALSEFSKELGLDFKSFVLTGASKRGWTTYLTGAMDQRVAAIAPMVFDMLNMKAQTDWAAAAYGAQSEKIKNYTELGLIERIEEPRTIKLRSWIDPYSYKERLTMPKLILLGTNDPYWVVDAQIHYYFSLPAPKAIYQVPNGDHHISSDPVLRKTLALWFKRVANRELMPEINWEVSAVGKEKQLKLSSNQRIKKISLWQADSASRDFRNAKWHELGASPSGALRLVPPESGFRAFIGEAELLSGEKLSTTTFVIKAKKP